MFARSACLSVLLMGFLLCTHVPPIFADRDIEDVEEKSFEMGRGGVITITANEGYVRIIAWDRSEVSLKMTRHARGKNKREAQRRLEEIDVSLERSGDRLMIREKALEDHVHSLFDLLDPDRWSQLSSHVTWVDFDLTVPRQTDLIITTDEGNITVSHIEGEVDIDSDEGNIELSRVRSDRISVLTDEGDILLEEIRPQDSPSSSRIEIDSDESNVELVDVEAGRVKIESDEGDVVADRLRCERLDFYSDEGNIEAELDVRPDGDYRCRTDEGDIVLFLPEDVSFDITARTQEGEIRSDFPLEVRDVGDGERVDDVVRSGGGKLYLFTEEGDILLRKKRS